MISSTSLSAFSTGIGPTRPTHQPHPPQGVQQARAQPKQQLPLQAQPDKHGPAPQPGQTLPRGSLLDLSV